MEAAIAAQKHAPLPIAEPRRRRLILGFLKNSPGGVDHRGEFRGSKLANLPLHEVTCKTKATDLCAQKRARRGGRCYAGLRCCQSALRISPETRISHDTQELPQTTYPRVVASTVADSRKGRPVAGAAH